MRKQEKRMDTRQELESIVGNGNVLSGSGIEEDYTKDECLTVAPEHPAFVVKPVTTDQVARIMKLANEHGIPVTARGSGTGLSGASTPSHHGIVLSLERMNRVLEIDAENHVAVVEPGVTLGQLDEETAKKDLVYPIFPGEASATLGGNVATNAGGMRAVKYGVTRHQILGLEAVLANGEVVQSGGKFVKVSSGYDLTQLIIGSEGTLAIVTKVILKLMPRLAHRMTMLVPFPTLDGATGSVPALLQSGVGPLMIEYIDRMTMMGITSFSNIELRVAQDIQDKTEAYLLVVVEGRSAEDVERDVEAAGEVLTGQGALDVYVLAGAAAPQLIEARERSFWAGKRAGATDILDIVVPRGAIPPYAAKVREIAMKHQTMVVGCGHAGDGNIHLGVFQPDAEKLRAVMEDLLAAGLAFGGAVSAEHGIGRAKKKYFAALEDPTKLALMRGIKKVFDPKNILNPGAVFD
jgi:glycolate oxidase